MKNILENLALTEGISVENLRNEMELAIGEAYVNPNSNAKRVPAKGKIPTIEEFLEYAILSAVLGMNENKIG